MIGGQSDRVRMFCFFKTWKGEGGERDRERGRHRERETETDRETESEEREGGRERENTNLKRKEFLKAIYHLLILRPLSRLTSKRKSR